MKPYYEHAGVTLYHGDNIATMQEMIPDASVDLVVTSPPYDNLRTYSAGKPMSELWDFEGVAQQLWRVIKPGGVVVWVVNDETVDGDETGESFRQALGLKAKGFRLHDTMIYTKNGAPFPESNRYYPCFEFMFVLSKGKPSTTNLLKDRKNLWAGISHVSCQERQPDGGIRLPRRMATYEEFGVRRNVWMYDTGAHKSTKDGIAFEHPAIFPESLARDHILSWSNEGGIVLDPFSGSGTTAKMARLMGRNYIGIEINERYCEIAASRLAQGVLF